MNKQLILLLSIILLMSCSDNKPKNKEINTVTVIKSDTVIAPNNPKITVKTDNQIDNLPEWVVESIVSQSTINRNYNIEKRLKPLYLEEDFNGDGYKDVVIPIAEIKSHKKGFAVIHGKTFEIFILGAGKLFKNALGDNLDYIDSWKINRKKENEPGVDEETGNGKEGMLILEHPSIEIEKSELGGGQIYWDGEEYAYFHQTC